MAIWLLASGLVLTAGFAVVRGGICAVAGVTHLVETGQPRIFLSFLECSAWALLALVAANSLGIMSIAGWPSRMLVAGALAGGALFGFGALLNGACAFGTVGRLGSGDISFLALIPGFLFGVWSLRWAGMSVAPSAAAPAYVDSAVLTPLVLVLAVFALWRLWTAVRFARTPGKVSQLAGSAWPPALAVAVIALVNVALLLVVFSWPYTSLLADIANGRSAELVGRATLALALLGGAIAGAATAGKFHFRPPGMSDTARHFGGGVLMGAGAAIIPGGNDSLVLIGLPLLQPSAAAAYVAMVGAIAAGLVLRRIWSKQRSAEV